MHKYFCERCKQEKKCNIRDRKMVEYLCSSMWYYGVAVLPVYGAVWQSVYMG